MFKLRPDSFLNKIILYCIVLLCDNIIHLFTFIHNKMQHIKK